MPLTALSSHLSTHALTIRTHAELTDWLRDAEREVGGVQWRPVGDESDNIHTIEVSSDPALAMLERVTNGIDAVLDLRACELAQTAATPHEAAQRWWNIPAGGPGKMGEAQRFELGGRVRVIMEESTEDERPTVVIQDQGTGQHPDDFPNTLLSLHRSNKKTKMHQMGQYNAGGAASYKFAAATVVISRLAPTLLAAGRSDEAGITVVRYNPLDPDRFKSGTYEYMVSKNGTIIRLAFPKLPDLEFGTMIRLVSYLMPKYAKAAFGPKSSLWHLLHAALPEPALPIRIVETRRARFKGMKKDIENRTILGLRHLLGRKDTSVYAEERSVRLGDAGSVILRYFVLAGDTEPEAYVTADHALALTMNGQRQGAKDRAWLQRRLELNFLAKRLIVLIDATGLTNAAKREVFSSTREHGVDTPLANTILDRVIEELRDDDGLYELEAIEKQRALDSATRTTTERVKRQLAGQIAALLRGRLQGKKGGLKAPKAAAKPPRAPRPPHPPQTDDSQMLDVPDTLRIVNDPLRIRAGGTASLRLELNAKNDFLPTHAQHLQVVVGPELKDHVLVGSTGRLLGGNLRVQFRSGHQTPETSASLSVALFIPQLGVALSAVGRVEVIRAEPPEPNDGGEGGEPNVEISWVRRDAWELLGFTEHSVGTCIVGREDPNDLDAITKVEWVLNESFVSYERVAVEKRTSEASLRAFRERYEMPVALALFRQKLAEEGKERQADEEGRRYDIPDDYVALEKERVANAVLMAIEPELRLAEAMA